MYEDTSSESICIGKNQLKGELRKRKIISIRKGIAEGTGPEAMPELFILIFAVPASKNPYMQVSLPGVLFFFPGTAKMGALSAKKGV